MTEVEATLNSQLLRTKILNDACAFKPLSLADLLTVKQKVVLPIPGQFQKTDIYCQRSSKRVLVFLEKWYCA